MLQMPVTDRVGMWGRVEDLGTNGNSTGIAGW